MALVVIKQDIDLGNVPRGTIKEFTFDLTNNSLYPIGFNCSVGCGCTMPTFDTMFMSQFSTQFPKVLLDTSNFGIGSFNKNINTLFV